MLQDETETYRFSDVFLIGLVNQSLKRIATLRPDLFAVTAAVSCVENEVRQSAPSDSMRVIEVFSVTGGSGLVEVNREVLDRTAPTWTTDTAGAATNWMRHVRNPNAFFIYPKAPSGQSIDVEYAQSPPALTALADTITVLPDGYLPSVIDGVMFLAESIDNEHITSGRAKLFQDSFVKGLGDSAQSRSLTDPETAALKDGEVL